MALAAISVRQDMAGVTSYVRCLGLPPRCYKSLLDMFHSRAIRLDKLTRLWAAIVVKTCAFHLYQVNGRYVCIGDGIKIAKEGKKMPAVKKLYQESQSNISWGTRVRALVCWPGVVRIFCHPSGFSHSLQGVYVV